ncbi:MAG: DNA recombination protein RmuC [Brachybacterium sp.]|nr:DNA recombination protein RmuC [Brachybacterium sp.]
MDPLTVILILLVGAAIGAMIGAIATFLVMRERARALDHLHRSSGDTSMMLRQLADERFERDAARREATEQARDAVLQRTLSPISSSLVQLERSMARTEAARSEADGSLREQLQELARRSQELGAGTHALTSALRAPTARGRWGEVQLRRIVEAAGMLDHVDFTEQHTARGVSGDAAQRPDLVVHLSGDRHVVIDAKAPMDAYLDAMEESDPQRARSRRAAHGKALRGHVERLGAKSYWSALGDSPEFVVLFVPSDGVLAAALESDQDLLEHAFTRDVVIASPATLVALLRTVAHTWRTDSLNRDAREVLEAGRELHHRLATMTSHLGKLGRSLDASVSSFNDTVGSLQSRVLVTARRFEEMGLVAAALQQPDQITRRSRQLAAEDNGGTDARDGEPTPEDS